MSRSGPMNAAVLLVEDDPVTAAFLSAASQAAVARVDVAGSRQEAIARATATDYAAWMIDANLPDGSGATLLQTLRERGLHTPAMAHTACTLSTTAEALQRAGFTQVLVKPISAVRWQAALLALLAGDAHAGAPSTAGQADDEDSLSVPIWDDAKAARALGGQLANVSALRTLFIEELPKQREAVRVGSAAERRQHLHRLRASCGLVGASRLDAASAALHDQPDDTTRLAHFLATADATLAAAHS